MENQDMSEIKNFLKKGQWKSLLIGVGVIIALIVFRPWIQVAVGEKGIVQNFDAVQDVVLDEGLHFKIPLVQTVTSTFTEAIELDSNMKAMEEWNRILPQVTGAGAIPFIGVDDVVKEN